MGGKICSSGREMPWNLAITPVRSLFGACGNAWGSVREREATIGTATHFNTQSVAQREKFSFWREAVCDAYVHLGCNSANPDRFDGEIILYRMSSVSVSFVGGSQQEVRRRKRDIMRASEASFLISMQLKLETRFSQRDVVTHLLDMLRSRFKKQRVLIRCKTGNEIELLRKSLSTFVM